MKEKIKTIMAEIFKEEVKDDVSQNNFEKWDSMAHLNIVIKLEESFKISYEPGEIGRMFDLKTVVDITEKKLG